jgi:predicted phosphodiesterase
MKIDVISDIHLTCFKDFGTSWIEDWAPQAEVLVLAGDVGEFHWWQLSFDRVRALSEKYQHVLYIAGNHDYYGTTLQGGDARFREIEDQLPSFHFLEQDILEIDGVKFAGCALWFKQDPLGFMYEKWMSDFSHIKQFKPEVYYRNQGSQSFLQGVPYDTDVVITHHMPSQLSVHAKYAGDPCNRFFLCEMDEVILDLQPKVWIHGHTHIPFDYLIGDTRVLCNPMGYPHERPGVYGPVTIEI